MVRPLICVSLTRCDDVGKVSDVDLVEVRIDMLGSCWRKVINDLRVQWIACNRKVDEGGLWSGDEYSRVMELFKAVELGASFVDIELSTADVKSVVSRLKRCGVKVIISKHITTHTPSLDELRVIVNQMINLGADVWKVVTKANDIRDNLVVLQLIKEFKVPGISLAMGDLGVISRVLSPLVGGFLTYASVSKGSESAPGQLTVYELKSIYKLLGVDV
ncbi:MAG: type I 3-dehydroquinate dehydratase [Desulfurococcaceae archaeon]|nr:type I 3-dehydroquinate dehydratase [Desulfurococcaceae archaeon]